MQILYSPQFGRQYKKLPNEIKDRAEEIETIFRRNPFDSRLKTHKLSGRLKDFYSFSITHSYSIIFDLPKKGIARFYEIGDHSIYE